MKELYAELDAQRQAQEPKDHTDSEGDSAEESKGDKEQKPKTKKKLRGKAKGSKKKSRSNYLFYHGAKPEFGVDAASVMVNDVFRMLRRFNRKTLTTVLPDALEYLVAEDADMEVIASQTAEKLEIDYRGNIVTSSRAIVFVCDKLVAQQNKKRPTLTYDNAEERA